MINTSDVLATLSYVKRFSGTTVLVKIGGAALTQPDLTASIAEDLALLHSFGISTVVVHGGGPSINRELTLRGIQWEFLDGLRITTPQMMDVIEMVLCGSVNRFLVRTINRAGVRAVGLSGADASTFVCMPMSSKLERVGTISRVNTDLIRAILGRQDEGGLGGIPVIAPVGVGESGEAFNINADWAACRTARALGIRKILFLTDQQGILDAKGSLIPELDSGELQGLIEAGVVKGGMLAKVQTILYALENGVTDVHVLNSSRPHALIEEIFTEAGVGTVCRRENQESRAIRAV